MAAIPPETGIRRRGEMATLLIVFNAWQDVVKFRLPAVTDGAGWLLEMDTNQPGLPPDGQRFDVGHEYEVTGRSLVLFQLGWGFYTGWVNFYGLLLLPWVM